MNHVERSKAYTEYIASTRARDHKKAHEALQKVFDIESKDITDLCDDAVNMSLVDREVMLAVMAEDLRDLRDYQHINTHRQGLLSVFTDTSDLEANKDYMILQ